MILAVDEAVRAVIDMNREAAGLPLLTKEELLGGGVIDAVAVPVAGTPGVYTVRGIVKAVNDKGVDLNVTVADGEVTSGDEPAHLDAAGEATWTVKLDPPDAGKITVSRLDNKAGSLISIENIDVNGAWAGTFTLTEITLDEATQAASQGSGLRPGHTGGAEGSSLADDPRAQRRSGPDRHLDLRDRHLFDQGGRWQTDDSPNRRTRR